MVAVVAVAVLVCLGAERRGGGGGSLSTVGFDARHARRY